MTGTPTTDGSAAGSDTSSRSVLAGGAWNALREMLPQLYTLIQSVVAARILGPTDMGRQSYIAFVAISVKIVVTAGIPSALLRYVAEWVGRGRPDVAAVIVRRAMTFELMAAGLGGGAVFALGLSRGDLQTAWIWAAVGSAFAVVQAIPHVVLMGTQRWRSAATISLVQGGLATIATVIVLQSGGGITGMFVVEAAAAGLSLVWTAYAVRGALPRAIAPPDVDELAQARRSFTRFASWTSLMAMVELIVWKRSEFIFLERYSTAAELAQYSVAFATVSAIARVPQGLATVLSPAVATLLGAGEHSRIKQGYGRSLRLLLLATLPITAGLVAVGPRLLVAVYGDDYRQAGTVLMILMFAFPVIPLAALGGSLLLGLGRIRSSLAAISVAGVIDVAAAAVLIRTWGAEGAAVANGLGQLVAGLLLVVLASRAVGGARLELGALLRATAAAVLCGVGAHLVLVAVPGLIGLAAGIVFGSGLFGLGMVLFRGVAADDAVWLSETMEDRFGARASDLVLRMGGRP